MKKNEANLKEEFAKKRPDLIDHIIWNSHTKPPSQNGITGIIYSFCLFIYACLYIDDSLIISKKLKIVTLGFDFFRTNTSNNNKANTIVMHMLCKIFTIYSFLYSPIIFLFSQR